MADFGEGLLGAIKGFEGYTANPAWDYKQWSSGYGTVGRPGETVDRDTAEQRLKVEVAKAADFVDKATPGLPPGIRDAMISLTFNAGGSWANSGLGEKLRSGDYAGAKETFQQYNKAGGKTNSGLVDRRNAEAQWWDKEGADTGSVAQGPKNMDDTGLLASLAPQSQSAPSGGLLGALKSPEALAYIAMIAKGLSPYSEVDPTAMLKMAQLQKEHAINQDFNRKRLGFEERGINLRENEARQKQQELEGSRAADAEIYGSAGKEGMGRDQILDYMKRYPNMSKSTRDFLESRLGAFENQGKITRDVEERKAAAKQLGLEEGTSAYQSYLATGNPGRNQPLTAADHKAIYTAEDELPAIQSTKSALARALELNGKTFDGIGAGVKGWLGTNLPMDHIDRQQAKDTMEWQKLTSLESTKTMAETLKGATTDFELRHFQEILSDPSTPKDIRERTLRRMYELAERQEKIKTDRLNQLREGNYFKPGGGSSAKPADKKGEVADPLGIR